MTMSDLPMTCCHVEGPRVMKRSKAQAMRGGRGKRWSDVQQKVLSNNKFKSATHRVVRPKGKSRYSYAFFYNLQGDKWVEPLSEFTEENGKALKYKGFL
ncbi:hypothetical protein JRO89_XS13G0170200 [Xanthoceras sorbifolium]|uniref:Isopenicillin N synthase-like Fe(2+) 2OG dioxygenase domain-containing protein n=1 Tax=Xanthoceras sorbifolium TaxID=99658 RepID=A0ABQ8H8T8_9ROSI|nr:hypothetical protein JRO89_XS13G0170200 [Xanthoceras sorbifolium]